jgi:hypothetical protein
MPVLVRIPLTLRRTQHYIDWANRTEGDLLMTPELAAAPGVYLIGPGDEEETLEQLLDARWPEIFECELAGWMEDESLWPAERTRETFDAWFDVTLGSGVIDLDPDEPLTDDGVDAEDIVHAMTLCAWCGAELPDSPLLVPFAVHDRGWLEELRGHVLTVLIDDEHVATGIVPSDEADHPLGEDVVFHACSQECGQSLKQLVPPALERRRAAN